VEGLWNGIICTIVASFIFTFSSVLFGSDILFSFRWGLQASITGGEHVIQILGLVLPYHVFFGGFGRHLEMVERLVSFPFRSPLW
jgi:hypothetical protein